MSDKWEVFVSFPVFCNLNSGMCEFVLTCHSQPWCSTTHLNVLPHRVCKQFISFFFFFFTKWENLQNLSSSSIKIFLPEICIKFNQRPFYHCRFAILWTHWSILITWKPSFSKRLKDKFNYGYCSAWEQEVWFRG